ncbi:MAG: aldo/keto reductase [Planctomyces sp.]|nr:aldo/keto reductase [Planctomyces sp.]
MELREIGNRGIRVTPIAMGCWPIAGVTTINVTKEEALGTIRAAYESEINFFDTAYAYGHNGESERYVGEVLGPHRDDVVVATKGGYHWENGKHCKDARPETLKRELEESLKRLRFEYVDIYYLHGPDPEIPVEKSAEAIAKFLEQGKTRAVGICNASLEQIKAFQTVCPLVVLQSHFNMLQQDVQNEVLPWCEEQGIGFTSYWPLMKGLLAGKLNRDHRFDERDSRRNYPIFQGEQWERNQDLVDVLRGIAAETGYTVAQIVVRWTMKQPRMTSVLCGARRPDQIRENAGAASITLTEQHERQIEEAIAERMKYEH